jgi:hypothetical protein
MTPLPKFQEPDWSKLPKEAVAWAVDASGLAYWHTEIPEPYGCIWPKREPLAPIAKFDLTNIDWRTTLRLRPVEPAKVEPVAFLEAELAKDHPAAVRAAYEIALGSVKESAMPKLKPDPHVLADRVAEESQRNYELERLAEDAWKARLAHLKVQEDGYAIVACEAFDLAKAFIDECEKRRNK